MMTKLLALLPLLLWSLAWALGGYPVPKREFARLENSHSQTKNLLIKCGFASLR